MKVMQLLPELNSGGVERGTLEIARTGCTRPQIFGCIKWRTISVST